VSQVKPQLALAQLAVELAGWGQAVHDEPQEFVAVFDTHAWPHACCPVGHAQLPPVHVPPEGQSALRRQPTWHRLETGSQK
jgi:hypothetical protein